MSTYVAFTPQVNAVFSFQPVLNGQLYTCTVPWNAYSQRYYIALSDPSGALVLYRPLASCGPRLPASFTWANGSAIASCDVAHDVPIGLVVPARVTQTGTGFDGEYSVLAADAYTLLYSVQPSPSQAQPITGLVEFNLNLVAGVVPGAWLFWRSSTQQFEFETTTT